MTRGRLGFVAVWGALAPVVLGPPAMGEEFHCRLGDNVRRVELLLTDDQDRLPCQVLYWRSNDQPAEPQILWRADFNLEFCFDKARTMIREMQSAGWRCGLVKQEMQAIEPAAPPPSPEPGDQALHEAVGRDLQRLEKLVGNAGGSFDLTQSALGDLDGDAVSDAAVLLDYEAGGVVKGTFLLAYVFRGDRFEPAAKTALGSDQRGVSGVTIERRVIELHGDPSATPDPGQRPAYVLRAGQLVALADGLAGDPARTPSSDARPGS